MMLGMTKPYSRDCTITELFERVVLQYPEQIAVYLEQDAITYRQFNTEVNQLAHYLREQGVTRNVIVGVAIERSYTMLVSIFAILKAGGAYLPIDPHYPVYRKTHIIQDAGVKFLLVNTDQAIDTSLPCTFLNPVAAQTKALSQQNLVSINQPDDIAYVIYTSGSTGMPKGVMIAHHALINRLEWMQDQFLIDGTDVLLQKTHCGFDVSIWELFWWAIVGAGVTLLPHGREDDVILMLKIMRAKKVSVVHFVPSVLRIFLDYYAIKFTNFPLENLKYVFASGEALDTKTVQQFTQMFPLTAPSIINLYGPTEATIDVSYFVCDKTKSYQEIPIGKPIYNTELLVLDEDGHPTPVGQEGELYIAGVNLAKGYLNNLEQTQRSFIHLPEQGHKMLYKTGDLVKINSEGELCYLGRKDLQVKINGIRIELGEIEYQLNRHENIQHAVVLAISLSDHMKKLVAFVQLKHAIKSLKSSDLNLFLQDRLPTYMHPKEYVLIHQFPLNLNGKLDRKRLIESYVQGVEQTPVFTN